MTFMVFLILTLAHLIADFYLQTEKMVKKKEKHIFLHLTHHFITTFFFLVLLYLWSNRMTSFLFHIMYPTVAIVCFHLLIDILKIKIWNKVAKGSKKNTWELILFITDQLLHFVSILLVSSFFFGKRTFHYFYQFILILERSPEVENYLSPMNLAMFIIIMLIITTTVSGHGIRLLLGTLPEHIALFEGKFTFDQVIGNVEMMKRDGKPGIMSEQYNYMLVRKQDLSRGKIIGYLERLIIIILVINDQYTAIAFILTAKSLARFKQMDDREWAEYFLLGTLSSIFLAIVYGIFIRSIIF